MHGVDLKVPVERLTPGMFVAELDRPWLDTPFLLQGFVIETPEQLDLLRRHCRHVYVDPLRSTRPVDVDTFEPRARPAWLAQEVNAPNWTLVEYTDSADLDSELPRARHVLQEAAQVAADLFGRLHQGEALDMAETTEVMDTMVGSVIRNPDALTLLAHIRRKSAYVYEHALGVSIHALVFGRHLGFDRPELLQLGLGGLLLDVGAARVPGELLSRTGPLSDAEYAAVKRHVRYGAEIVSQRWGLAGIVLDMVQGHHEREDGSGYPHRLQGPDIPVVAKMAAIVDCFDALTRHRPYAPAHTPHAALQMIYDWAGRTLNAPLVEEFVQAIGAFPVGSLVELNSGEVALVVAHNRVRRLKPRLLLLLDPDKQPYASPMTLDLIGDPLLPNGLPYAIMRALEDGMYGIDPRDYYL